ncbi:hypothetical protein AX14_013270 [Amanita brunnescens Koide BX004]|nr:hypothetical protein AX14_013270 [Amanita brunnescens Koide BX004]
MKVPHPAFVLFTQILSLVSPYVDKDVEAEPQNAPSLFQSASGVHISNSDFNVAGGDITIREITNGPGSTGQSAS